MRVPLLVAATLLALLAPAAVRGGGGEAVVTLLGPEQFAESTAQGLWIIDYFTPWCGFCKQLAPVYAEAAKRLADEGSRVHLAVVDCADPANADMCKQHGIRGYPTLRLWGQGQLLRDFANQRTIEGLTEAAYSLASEFPEAPVVANEQAQDIVVTKQEDVDTVVASSKANPEGKVIKLDATLFDELTQTGPWMLEFFAPWCGHCKKLAPTWEQLAAKMINKVNVGSVDCTVEANLCSRFGVRGYPTLKFAQDGGDLQDYKQGRGLDALTEFASRLLNANLKLIQAGDLDATLAKEAVSIFFLGSDADSAFAAEAEVWAKQFSLRAPCYYSTDRLIHEELKVKKLPAVVIAREGDLLHYSGAVSGAKNHAALKDWVNANRIPLLVEFDGSTAQDLLQSPKKLLLLIVDPSDATTDLRYKPEIKEAIKAYSKGASNPPINAAWINGIYWTTYATKTFSVPHMPYVILADPSNELFYPRTASGNDISVTQEGVLAALAELHNGQLEAKYMGGFFAYAARMASKTLQSFGDTIAQNLVQSLVIFVIVITVCFYLVFVYGSNSPSAVAIDSKKAS